MTKNSTGRREGRLLRLSESARELLAAWFVLAFVGAAALSILVVHPSSIDCTILVAKPGAHHHLAANQESDDPACTIGPCGHWQRGEAFESMQAAESGDGDAPIYSGSSSMSVLPRASGADQEERLC